MGFYRGPNIVTDGLLFTYDAGSERCYPGSGTSATNIMSQASPGTLQNGVGFNSANGGVWEFDGVDSKIEVTTFPTQVFNGPCTFESWVYWNDDTRSTILGNFDQGGGGHDINFEKVSGRNLRAYWDRGSINAFSGTNTVAIGEWQHVVMVRDVSGNAWKFYVNGALITSVSNAGSNIPTTGTTFRIGADSRNGDTVTNGNISIVRMYNQALTDEEVTQNYNAHKEKFI